MLAVPIEDNLPMAYRLAPVAAEIGVSQRHVPRLLRQALAHLRVGVLASTEGSTVEGRPHARR